MRQDERNAIASVIKVVLGSMSGLWGFAAAVLTEAADYWKAQPGLRDVESLIREASATISRHGEAKGWSHERTVALGRAAALAWEYHRPGDSEILKMDFDVESIVRHVIQRETELDKDDVTEIGTILSLVLEAVLTRIRPELELAFSREVLVRLRQISEQTTRIPVDSKFEDAYRKVLASYLNRVRFYGVSDHDDDFHYSLTSSFALLHGAVVVTGLATAESPTALRTLDEVLHSGKRFLIRGEAGFGKTTLLRWLAVQSARRQLTGLLEPWNWRVPFYFRLRDLVSVCPSPEDYPKQFAESIIGLMPHGWVTQQLLYGRALLLIDGLDEIPPPRRKEVRAWLDTLILHFPESVIIVTSRPAAAANGWLQSYEFADVELQPMSLTEIDSVIDGWYESAEQSDYLYTDSWSKNELKWIIREKNLHQLASTPALCALLCRFYTSQATVPRNMVELIRMGVEMLAYRRDLMRGIDSGFTAYRRMPTLLREIALWYVLNDRYSAVEEEVLNTISHLVSRDSELSDDPGEILHGLEERTGVLERMASNAISFRYIAFQQYLAAEAVVAAMHFDHLVKHAHLDEWDRVAVFAAAIANESAATRLLAMLIARSRATEDNSRKLTFLAIECFAAMGAPGGLMHLISPLIQEVSPPASTTEANALATMGDLVVDHKSLDVYPLIGLGMETSTGEGPCRRSSTWWISRRRNVLISLVC